MRKQRRFRTPFVITTAAAVSSISLMACGGSTNSDSGTGGTAGTSGSGGSTGGVGGSGGTGGAPGGSGGVGGTSVDAGANCPPTVPGWYEQCTAGQSCNYDVACQSGAQSFNYVCNENSFWDLAPKSCDKPYDSCPGTELYCNAGFGWSIPQGTNPPSPCPDTRPNPGDACSAAPMGGVWENCGYPCDATPTAKWTVLTCKYDPADPTGQSTWESDGACGP